MLLLVTGTKEARFNLRKMYEVENIDIDADTK
jgi:hypothetical protein